MSTYAERVLEEAEEAWLNGEISYQEACEIAKEMGYE